VNKLGLIHSVCEASYLCPTQKIKRNMANYEADNFIEEFIVADLENGKHDGRIHTRFPPEPNGYLHIGHAKAIVINFEIGKKFGGKSNRIKKETHHRTGDDWCIYPLYDFAHGQSDSIEKITHSLCSLEFRHHRDLYNWLIEALEIFPSRQIEFARMNVDYLITSKRRLKKLVDEGVVTGWDDPRMGTLAGMRRKGYPAAAIRNFCIRTGVTKRDNQQEFDFLEHCVREVLNDSADRYMAVLDPVKLVITNYPETGEMLTLDNNPGDEARGTREIPFSRELWVEREDYRKEPQNRK